MTTSDSRSVDDPRLVQDDELEVAREDQDYTPPVQDDTPVHGEVVDPPADPTPPDVAPEPEPEFAGEGLPDEPEPVVVPVAADTADDDRWQAIQVRFVDDPAGAVQQAAELVENAVSALRDGYASSESAGDSTEQLRRALRRYRSVHRSVTAPDA